MIRKFKFLSLALVAVMALTAVGASAASAAQFESETSPTYLSGDQKTESIFTVSGFPVKCSTTHFTGEQVGTVATEVTVHPEYGGCTFLEESNDYVTTGCNFTLGAATVQERATFVIGCNEGSQIRIYSWGCSMYIGSQTLTSAVSYKNEGSPGGILATFATGNRIQIAKKEGPLCGLFGNTASYTGSVLIKGYADAGHTTQIAVKYVE